MNLKKVLSTKTVKIGLPGTTKDEIITSLVDLIVSAATDLDRDRLLKAVFDREAQMSTGMKNGIAIPHGKTDAVNELHAALAVSAEPVPFDSLDQQPARIFVMTVSPQSHSGPHLQFLAEVSRLLSTDDQCRRVLAAGTEEELLRIFVEGNA